jgi:hypothetical protein
LPHRISESLRSTPPSSTVPMHGPSVSPTCSRCVQSTPAKSSQPDHGPVPDGPAAAGTKIPTTWPESCQLAQVWFSTIANNYGKCEALYISNKRPVDQQQQLYTRAGTNAQLMCRARLLLWPMMGDSTEEQADPRWGSKRQRSVHLSGCRAALPLVQFIPDSLRGVLLFHR